MKQMLAMFGALGVAALFISPAHADSVRWRGDVEDRAVVKIQGKKVWAQSNKGTKNVKQDVDGRLPDHPVRLTVDRHEGRGRVYILEQPSRSNNFTATVEIVDKGKGHSFYDFTVNWDDDRGRRGGGWDRDHSDHGGGWDRDRGNGRDRDR